MQNSTYNPNAESEYSKKYLQVNNIGVTGTITAGTSNNIDYTLTDDHLLIGAQILCNNSAFGDYCDVQIIHPQAGVVSQFFTNWYLGSDKQEKYNVETKFPAKLPAGLTIRLVYHSVGNVNVDVLLNLKLLKILI